MAVATAAAAAAAAAASSTGSSGMCECQTALLDPCLSASRRVQSFAELRWSPPESGGPCSTAPATPPVVNWNPLGLKEMINPV